MLAAKNGVGLMLLERYFIDIYYIMGVKKMKIKALTAFVILIMLVSAIPTPVQSLGTSVLPADQANNNRASCPYIENRRK